MKAILLSVDRKVVFDDANKQYAEATIYQLVPFLFWRRWSRVFSVFVVDDNYNLKTKDKIIEDLVAMADFKIEKKRKADEFNRGDS
tara:strand:- start:186 stop:443 length:258 start_codon:yes stop_codon:yes gene_type:complete